MSKETRRIRALSMAVIFLGVFAGAVASADPITGCGSICATFCPSNLDEYCMETADCGPGKDCTLDECPVGEYRFPRTIICEDA
jgi:hypothetical protein